MSPQPDDLPPGFGELGQSPEDYERQRLRELNALKAAERLNEAEADRPMRENFGANEQESWDTPESTHEGIARMKASRAPALIRAAGQLTPALAPSVPEIFDANAKAELRVMVQAVVGELSRELHGALSSLKADIGDSNRLLKHIDVPLESITKSHEKAAESFETLREDLSRIGLETPGAIRDLARVMDTAGLNEAQSRAERRFEELTRRIEKQMEIIVDSQSKAFRALAADMVKVLHLLERLQARELADAKKRAKK